MLASDVNLMLERLEKAVHSGNITEVVPEDLEAEAHNTLWEETDPTELTLLKLLPSVPAYNIEHKFSKVTSYGHSRNSGFFSERSLPPETNFRASRVTVDIKLMGEIGPTFLLAALERTQRALGTSGAQNIERVALRRNVLKKKNVNLYFSDDRVTNNTLRFKGLLQQIEEGTDGTVGTASPFGTHVIDMEGDPLTVDTIRERVAKGIQLFGRFTSLIMDPLARADLEASMDAAHRLNLPIAANPLLIGQNIGGIQTQGGTTYFETDNSLSTIYSRPQYSTDVADGAPSTRPTVVVTAQADNSSGDTVDSLFDAASAGNLFWVVTELVGELEGLGTRYPASTASFVAVAAGQEAKLVITPGNPLADSFKVYRGNEDDGAEATDAWFIFEVANDGGGAAVTVYDNNEWRPNTSCAFGLNIVSRSERAIHSGQIGSYAAAAANSAQFLKNNDVPGRNTVAVAELGPSMGIMALASVLAQVDRPLIYSACAPEIRNPYQNVVFKNIGRR